MAKKTNLEKYINEIETKSEKESFVKYGKVIDGINSEMPFDIRNENAKNDYDNFDMFMQMAVVSYNEYPQMIALFDKYAKKNGFNPKEYLKYAMKKITENASNVEAFVTGLLDNGIIDDIYVNDDEKWTIESELANFSFEVANIYFEDYSEILDYIDDIENRKGGCHKNAEFLLNFFKDGEAITAKLKNLVGIYFYHSYYRFDGMICDLNNNVVMSEEDFNLLNEPEIISVLRYEEYKDKIETLNSTLMPLLEIALLKECEK